MPYRPLPNKTRLSQGVEGLGIFADSNICAGDIVGLGHIKRFSEPDGWLRTPLGGFINHSLTPNCQAQLRGDEILIVALKDIHEDEELTVFYWLESYKFPVTTGQWDHQGEEHNEDIL